MIIGVCGTSCSGKSTICKKLVEMYPNEIMHIKSDKFFKKTCKNIYDGIPIWNSPEDINFEMLIKTLQDLKTKEFAYMPNKAFSEKADKKIKSRKIILLDGFLIYTNEELVELIDKKVYLDLSVKELIKRRISREKDSVDFIHKVVIEPNKKYESSQKESVDIFINADNDIEKVLYDLLQIIKPKLISNHSK